MHMHTAKDLLNKPEEEHDFGEMDKGSAYLFLKVLKRLDKIEKKLFPEEEEAPKSPPLEAEEPTESEDTHKHSEDQNL